MAKDDEAEILVFDTLHDFQVGAENERATAASTAEARARCEREGWAFCQVWKGGRLVASLRLGKWSKPG
jgi:hypothetical protein